MDKTEKIVLTVAAIGLVALLIAKYREPSQSLTNVQPVEQAVGGSETSGPLYLLGNMPWAYQPWVGDIIPQATSGQIGQTLAMTQGATAFNTVSPSGDNLF